MILCLIFRRNELVNSDFLEEFFGMGPGVSTGLQFGFGYIMATSPNIEAEDNELSMSLKTS